MNSTFYEFIKLDFPKKQRTTNPNFSRACSAQRVKIFQLRKKDRGTKCNLIIVAIIYFN